MKPDANRLTLSPTGVLAIGGLLVLTVAYRLGASQVDFLGNTAPIMGVAFGGALLLGRGFWWLPLLLLVCSDLVLGMWHGQGGVGLYTLMSALFYCLVAQVGWRVGRSARVKRWWPTMWLGTLACGVVFYVIANTYSWAVFPGYERSLAGWWQAQTIGVPGINPPAWFFLRNALIADSLWCLVAGLVVWIGRYKASKVDPSGACGERVCP